MRTVFFEIEPTIEYTNHMEHYICMGECKGVSKSPGNCAAKDGAKYGEPLKPCECEDMKHEGRQETSKEKPRRKP